MLYIGHFSFDELKDEEIRHGYFTCIIDTESQDNAVAKFSHHILKLHKSEDFFSSLLRIYIEDIIEVQTVPDEPFITLFQSSEGSFPKSISFSLPASIKEGVEAFGLPANVRKHEQKEGDTYMISEPFINFNEE
jgi:hypothetical protein